MSLIGRLLDKLLTKGRITLKLPGKKPETFGRGSDKHLTVRFTDQKVAFDILRNPRLGFGEAYMDGRIIIEDGTILDLLRMMGRRSKGAQQRQGDPHAQAVLIAEQPQARTQECRAPLRSQRRSL